MKKQSLPKLKKALPKKKLLYTRPRKKGKKDRGMIPPPPLPLPITQEPEESPSISRIIPEVLSFHSLRGVVWNKYFLVSFVSAFIGVAITLQGIDLHKHVRQLQALRNQREHIVKEIAYWEDVTAKHQDYRDGYYKLALLEYQLGNREKARMYTTKALEIDPNYKEARLFEEKLRKERGN